MCRRWVLTFACVLGLSGTAVVVRQCLAQGPRPEPVVVFLGDSTEPSECAWRHGTAQPHHWRDCMLQRDDMLNR
jgi:hypothetical protein